MICAEEAKFVTLSLSDIIVHLKCAIAMEILVFLSFKQTENVLLLT